MGASIFHLAVIFASSIVIMYSCNSFEQAANYIGRNMGHGARGTLLDAVGSSLPELMVTMMFVATGQPELILAGVAVTAGSAIFNSVLIPAASILAAKNADGSKASGFRLDRRTIVRDGFWLLLVESVLIIMLGFNEFTALMCGLLIALYVMFAFHVIWDSKKSGTDGDIDEYEYEALESDSFLEALYKFDFNYLLFKDRPLTTFSAWVVLLAAVVVIGIACHFLAVSIEGFAVGIGVPVYFAAVVLGAAATSVPDTILSVKSAQRGGGADAVGNAIGSNIFDVTLSLAIPMLIAIIAYEKALPIEQSGDLSVLRWFVLGVSAAVIAGLYMNYQNVGKKVAFAFLGMYAIWIGYIALPFVVSSPAVA